MANARGTRLGRAVAAYFGFGSNVPDEVVVVGDSRRLSTGLYHAFLKARWPASLLVLVTSFLAVNVVFAGLYLGVGGIANARVGYFWDAFFFSVHTMATIGYGSMFPETFAAHCLVVAEAIVGLLVTAMSTGLVFAKFTTPNARIVFASRAVISPMNGVPTLSIRVGNEHGSLVVEATIRLVMTRTEHTLEGAVFYRSTDLTLVRAHASALSRTWSVFHKLDASSPLHGLGPADLAAQEVELLVSVTGTDETTTQPMLARGRYASGDIVFGARYADALRELPDGRLELDVRRFDVIEPSTPTESFPYRWAP